MGTGDVHYLTAADAVPHEALLCIQTNDTLDNPNRFRFSNHGFYLKSPQEMYGLMAQPWGEDMLRRTVEIADRCNAHIDLDAVHLPKFDVPDGKTAVAYLRELAEAGLRERYGAETPELRDRLEFELRTIEEMGFPDYFLIVWDFIRFARSDGVSVGPGRGSAAGSLVAYCLHITDLDPIRYSLLFERFLNPGRKTLPDVDVDFAVAGRERVINYVAEKYGRRNVAQIITFGKMQPKAAIKDAGRVMGIPYGVVDRIAKLVPEVPKVTFESCMKPGAELRRSYDTDEITKKIVDMALPLEGVVRNDSIHAAAVVIGDRPLTEYLPLQQKGSDAEVVTQFSMGDVDALGLLKMDFLGLRNLDVIDRAVEVIEQSRGVRLDMDALPLDDRPTYDMMARGDSTGVFQFESSGMREALRQVKPTEFEDLIALNALYRPGPMQNIPDYARNKANPSRVTYEDERLKPVLESTYGICVYQEQFMEIAKAVAAFSPAEADDLRKAIGKKIQSLMASLKEKFIEGCARGGASEAVGAVAVGEDRGCGRLRVPQGPCRLLRPHRLPHRLPACQLPGRIHGRADLVGDVHEGPGAVLCHGVRRHGARGAPSRRQHEPVGLHRRRWPHPLRPVGRQARRRRRRAGHHRRPRGASDRVDLGLLRAGRPVGREPGHAREPGGMRRARLHRRHPDGDDRGARAGALKRPEDPDRRHGRAGLDLRPRGDGVEWRRARRPQPFPVGLEEWPRDDLLRREKEVLGLYVSSHPLAPLRDQLARKVDVPLKALADLPDGKTVTVGGIVVRTAPADDQAWRPDGGGRARRHVGHGRGAGVREHVGDLPRRAATRCDRPDQGQGRPPLRGRGEAAGARGDAV